MVASLHKWSCLVLALLLMLPAGVSSGKGLHPFFVSVTEIGYNEGERSLEISCKVFTDDLEKALRKVHGPGVDLYHPKDKAVLEEQLSVYITRKLKLVVEGKPVQLHFIGYELEEQSTFSYFEVKELPKPPRKVDVSNALFYELYEKQMGIIHLTVNGKRISNRVEFPETDSHFEF
ncbi:MAG: hypothetical protein RL732_1548 [Bacteroidota bacterium]